MLRKILLYAGSFLAAITVLWSALILTSLVPNEAIKDNLISSALYLNGADPFFQPAGRSSVTDNYADVILLNVIWNIDSENPVVLSGRLYFPYLSNNVYLLFFLNSVLPYNVDSTPYLSIIVCFYLS